MTMPDGGRNAGRNFHGERLSNEPHASRTDPQAKLARKSQAYPAQPSYSGCPLMENRNGLVAASTLVPAGGTAERDAGLAMIGGVPRAKTLGAEKGYDASRQEIPSTSPIPATTSVIRFAHIEQREIKSCALIAQPARVLVTMASSLVAFETPALPRTRRAGMTLLPGGVCDPASIAFRCRRSMPS